MYRFECSFRTADCADTNYSCFTAIYDGWNFNSGNYLFTTDTK